MSKPVAIVPEPAPRASATIVTVTVEVAQRWLARNTHNRHLRQSRVDALARDMAEGRWVFNGSPIRFSVDEVLLDGQHRLHAVVKSGVAIEVVVVHDLSPESQETMDNGPARSVADALALRGQQNPTLAPSVARIIAHWRHGNRWNFSNLQTTHAELLEMIDTDERVMMAAGRAAEHRRTILAPPSVIGFCWWLFAGINRGDADFFMERLSSGIELPERHPILVLRRRLTDMRTQARLATSRTEVYIALFVRTWNAFRQGRRLTTLVAYTGRGDEQFPEPK